MSILEAYYKEKEREDPEPPHRFTKDQEVWKSLLTHIKFNKLQASNQLRTPNVSFNFPNFRAEGDRNYALVRH